MKKRFALKTTLAFDIWHPALSNIIMWARDWESSCGANPRRENRCAPLAQSCTQLFSADQVAHIRLTSLWREHAHFSFRPRRKSCEAVKKAEAREEVFTFGLQQQLQITRAATLAVFHPQRQKFHQMRALLTRGKKWRGRLRFICCAICCRFP